MEIFAVSVKGVSIDPLRADGAEGTLRLVAGGSVNLLMFCLAFREIVWCTCGPLRLSPVSAVLLEKGNARLYILASDLSPALCALDQ